MDTRQSKKAEIGPERLGPYRLEAQIGVGGMGAVYKGYDERLHRPVALKRLRRHFSSSEKAVEEARAIAQLSHPNIVQVYDLLHHEGVDWIVMEYVRGQTLRSMLRGGPLQVEPLRTYALDIAKGLAAAHGRGLVHRDLKTENVMIDEEGRAKILDFGLATALGDSASVPKSSGGRVQGTPRAMSPEQAVGEPVDTRSDLFALGVLLYECVSGMSPFSQKTRDAYQVLWRVCTYEPAPLCDVQPGVSTSLSDLVDRLLAKDPNRRPQSTEEVVLALQRTDSEDPSTVQVLFVDDEPDLEHLIRRWIQRGLDHNVAYDVKFARDGKEALEVLAANPSISLLFTDLRMPQLDGIGLLRELRRHDKFCVAVVVSAFGDLKNIRSAMNLGAFDFLTKPFDFEDLGKTLGKAVQQMVTVRESIRLRAENQLLEERNKVIQVAFSRFLQGDPELAQAFSPLIDYLQGEDGRPLTVLTLSLEGVNDMTLQLASPQLVPLLRQFLEEIVVITRLHRGEVLRLEQQHLSVGFDLRARGVDVGRARSCARDFRQAVFRLSNQSEERGGPAIHAKFAIDSGEVTIDSQTGDLSGSVIDRMGDLLDQCKVDEILVTDRARGTDPPGQGATATTLADF